MENNIEVISTPHKKRLFLGITILDDIKEALKLQLRKIPGRSIPMQNWHFTLHFLGEVEEERVAMLNQALKEIDLGHHFKCNIAYLSAFPSVRSARIIWVGVAEGATLFSELAEKLRIQLKNLGFKIDERDYIPHLTLSRLSSPWNLNRWIRKNPIKKITFEVLEVVVYESVFPKEGGPPLYFPLFRYPLK